MLCKPLLSPKTLPNCNKAYSTVNTSKKIKSVDLNREPAQIANLNLVTSFGQGNNWFFESLMNPLLSVGIDLSGQIDENVNKVLSICM